MGLPMFRFTFYHEDLFPDGVVVNQPLNWADASIALVRDPEGHSLVEFFKGEFIWYGRARERILEVDAADGPDAKLRLKIELTESLIVSWDLVFNGLLDVSLKENISVLDTFYKIKVPIVQDDFWVKFMNKKDTPVNIEDGAAKIVLPLPSQKIREIGNYFGKRIEDNGRVAVGDTIYYAWGTSEEDVLQYVWGVFDIDEVKQRFNLELVDVATPDDVANFLELPLAGDLRLQIRIDCQERAPQVDQGATDSFLEWYLQKNDEAPIAFTKTTVLKWPIAFPTTNKITQYTIDQTFTIVPGDRVKIYPQRTAASEFIEIMYDGFNHVQFGETYTYRNYANVYQDTLSPPTETDSFLIGDAGKSIVDQICGVPDTFVSTFFEESCKRLNAYMKGIHVRGYTFAEKPYFRTFKQWWECVDRLLCLGFGYKEVLGVPKIQVEDRSFFFSDEVSISFDNVPNIVTKYHLPKIIKNIKVGAKDWSAESGSGIDDGAKQDKKTRFERIGVDIVVETAAVVAGLAIEQTRRNRRDKTKDWRFDEKDMIIAVKEDEEAPDGVSPEFDERFVAVNNVLNPSFRYNLIHFPSRIWKRHQPFWEGCLKAGDKFFFAGGEGNTLASSELDPSDCEYSDQEPIAENADLNYTGLQYLTTDLSEARIPMTWSNYKTIRNNREKAIEVNGTKYSIMDGDGYHFMGGFAEFVLLKKPA